MPISKATLLALENNDAKVDTISLCNEDIKEIFPQIVKILATNTHLKTLTLSRAGLTDENVITLMAALQSNPAGQLRSISLSGNNLTGNIVSAINGFLEKSVTLHSFSLTDNGLNVDDIRGIMRTNAGKSNKVTHLIFDGNPGAAQLSPQESSKVCSSPRPRSKPSFFQPFAESSALAKLKSSRSASIEKLLGFF